MQILGICVIINNVRSFYRQRIQQNARVAQLVEYDLAKVGVAGSSPVSRSFFIFRIQIPVSGICIFFISQEMKNAPGGVPREWKGDAPGGTPVSVSELIAKNAFRWYNRKREWGEYGHINTVLEKGQKLC